MLNDARLLSTIFLEKANLFRRSGWMLQRLMSLKLSREPRNILDGVQM